MSDKGSLGHISWVHQHLPISFSTIYFAKKSLATELRQHFINSGQLVLIRWCVEIKLPIIYTKTKLILRRRFGCEYNTCSVFRIIRHLFNNSLIQRVLDFIINKLFLCL
eukprot:NODE_77_length_23806_cov_0.393892.p17 type:complete len:109 gc:universal NODE_77_length_23806_cov_0.393892:9126-8800(-)